MKNLLKKSLLASAAILFTVSVAQNVQAQTVTVNATADVSNELTLTVASPMNFGSFIAIGGPTPATDTGTITIGTDGVLSAAAAGTDSNAAIIDDSAATAAEITIADGAPGATINVLIDGVVDPTDGTDSLTLTDFVTSTNGGADQSRTAGAGNEFTITYGASSPSTMIIGASLVTNATGAVGDGAYAGSFDVTYSY